MEEEKSRRAHQLLRWGFALAGAAEIFFGGLSYGGKAYVMMGFLFVEGIAKILLAYCLPLLGKKVAGGEVGVESGDEA